MNEWQGGRCRSLTQLKGSRRSDEVNVGRQGCCIFLLYCAWRTGSFMYQVNASGLLNVVSVAARRLRLGRHREPGVCTGWGRPRARPGWQERGAPNPRRPGHNRAYGCARGLLAGVRPGHVPRNGYAHRVSANLRAACRSHLASRFGHRAGLSPNWIGSEAEAIRSRLRRALLGRLAPGKAFLLPESRGASGVQACGLTL